MKIVEKDFKVELTDNYFTLSFLKTKKELKEDSTDSYKLGGYYNHFRNTLIAVLSWRESKKYPFAETRVDAKEKYMKVLKAENKLKILCKPLRDSIVEFKEQIYAK